PLVVTQHPQAGKRNLGMYRMQVFDKNTTGMHWHAHKGGAEHYRVAEKLGQRLPVSVAIGADPTCVYAATAPLPEDMDELFLAGYLRKKSVDIVKCITNDLYVPANAQYVLEGYVDSSERRAEGPFGDHSGFYSLAGEFPVFHVTCLTMRKNPIYHATIVGRPPMEDAFLGKATERLFLPIICSLFFVLAGLVAAMPWPYFAGIAIVAFLLVMEHRILSGARFERNKSGIFYCEQLRKCDFACRSSCITLTRLNDLTKEFEVIDCSSRM
ncbi:MAG TPA: hypothetical protein ENG73_11240, partial [Desulfobacterales bacterium]|nr:hypothetical protein [Desulfobacterales bacterium]